MASKRCPKGTIERTGYTANRRGKKVKVSSSCIRATSASGSKRSTVDRAALATRKKIQAKVGKKYGKSNCPAGTIERAGYTKKGYKRRSFTRKSGSFVKGTSVGPSEVPPTCITDRGTPGKGLKIPTVLEKGVLKKVGYNNVRNMSLAERHAALERANGSIKNPLSLFRKLIVVSTMNKRTNPDVSKIFKEDAYWVRATFGLMKIEPSGSKSRNVRSSKNPSGSKTSKSKTSKSKKPSGSKTSKSKTSKSKTSKSKSRSK